MLEVLVLFTHHHLEVVPIPYLAQSLLLAAVALVITPKQARLAALVEVGVIMALAARAPPDHPYKDIMAALVLLLLDHIWEVEVEALVQ